MPDSVRVGKRAIRPPASGRASCGSAKKGLRMTTVTFSAFSSGSRLSAGMTFYRGGTSPPPACSKILKMIMQSPFRLRMADCFSRLHRDRNDGVILWDEPKYYHNPLLKIRSASRPTVQGLGNGKRLGCACKFSMRAHPFSYHKQQWQQNLLHKSGHLYHVEL